MTRKAFWWIAAAYAILALGVIGAQIMITRSANRIDDQTKRLNQAIGAACEVGIAPDKQEPMVVHQLATGQLVISSHDCQVIVRKLTQGESP